MTVAADQRVGTDLGPYRIVSVLGHGGMGVVYLAEQPSLGRRVALKILSPGLAQDAAFRARFERESRMAAAIDDPNILPVHEAGEIDGVLFIAMRYVEGTDLEARLRNGPLEPRAVVHLLGQIASALDAAHLRGIVHRDVKPANILIAPGSGDERGEHAYLADFGLTKPRDEDTSLTQAGTLLGTLDYMAPEQLEGREVSGAADQYALATIAFRALTGHLPFERDTDVAIISAHLKEPPPSAHELAASLPVGVDGVIARGMAKAPGDRYPSCSAFVGGLREALGIGATSPVAPVRQRNPWTVIAVVGSGFLALAGIVGWLQAVDDGATTSAPPLSASPPVGATAPPSPGTGASPGGPSATAAAFPDAAEAELLALLPSDMARTCDRGPYETVTALRDILADPIVSIRCSPNVGSGANDVIIRGFRPPSAGNTRGSSGSVDDMVNGFAIRARVTGGDCADSPRGVGPWEIGGSQVGYVTCFVDATTGDATLYWSYRDARLLVRAVHPRGDSEALYGFFEDTARFIAP